MRDKSGEKDGGEGEKKEEGEKGRYGFSYYDRQNEDELWLRILIEYIDILTSHPLF
jgi:hypothetical protein